MAANKTVRVFATGPTGWVVKTQAGKHISIVDQPEELGGTNTGPTPLDYIFIALGGCLVTIGKMVALQRRIELRGIEVEISGEVNLDVLRGKEKNERAGYKSIEVNIKVDADLTEEEKQDFIHEVDRRCPVSDNLIQTTPMIVKLIG